MAGKFVGSASRDDTTSWDIEAVAAQLSFLQGEVLTIVDSLLPDGRQLKAAKDLVKGAFRNRERYMRDLSGGVVGAQGGTVDVVPTVVANLIQVAKAVRNIKRAVIDAADDVVDTFAQHHVNQKVWLNTVTLDDGSKAVVSGFSFDVPVRRMAHFGNGQISASVGE